MIISYELNINIIWNRLTEMTEFNDPDNWFEIHRIDNYLYTIRERLDLIEPRFLTKYINNYLIIGEHTAALIDTGTGIHKISAIINKLIADRQLIIINTHNHFDHVLSNHEFSEVYIHKLDYREIADIIDVSYLEDREIESYARFNYKIPNCKIMNILEGGEIFDLGNITIEILHTPGHTPGSICLLSSENHLFTGDVIHYGSMYLPHNYENYDKLLVELKSKIGNKTRLFPGHENYNVGIELIDQFNEVFGKIERAESHYNKFLDANVIEFDKFSIIIEHKE